ncbi:hypothetical protein FAY30_26560 (plasmid) [Bacillus sp. S3]|uniref:hypothetical protein n=1 Tax=Bacillus sp. S3 TaxID=486398 RepID=UPI001188C296|nr:hypothetical protein [Bacillus sp. S3]QCJ45504.1 hypothetical protein FAY30_26560 [Bacillus sp. S3]
MNTILSVANGVLQYHRGKQTGLAGLMGIVVALIIVFQWDNILPILDAMGIVDFLDKHSLIYKGEGYLTGYVLFKLAFKASLLFVAALACLLVIAMIITMFSSSEIGGKITLAIFIVISFPFLSIYFLYDAITTPKAVKEERYRLAKERNKPVIEVLKESFEVIDKESARARLNRLPTTGDYHFLLAVTENEDIFAVLPRARYWMENPVIKLKVEKYDEKKDKASFGQYQVKQFKVTYDHGDYNEKLQYDVLQSKLNLDDEEVVYILKPEHDFNHVFKWITNSLGFKTYTNEQIKTYFKRKQNLLDAISKSETQEDFDRYVAVIKEMDASNEDIVKIMLDSRVVEV